jgi:hypothetical protein
MSRTLDLSAFEALSFSNEKTAEIHGGTCTGGGYINHGVGLVTSWSSDETCDDGTTEYVDYCIEYEL